MASFDPDIPGGALPSRLPVSYSECLSTIKWISSTVHRYTSPFRDGYPVSQSCRTKLFRALPETETKGIIENRHGGVNRQAGRKALFYGWTTVPFTLFTASTGLVKSFGGDSCSTTLFVGKILTTLECASGITVVAPAP